MLDKILPLQEVFMTSLKSAADKLEFLMGVSTILAKEESDTKIILGVFILFEDENRWCYQWDGAGFVPGTFGFPNHTGFAIYVNDGRDRNLYHSLHNESVRAIPLSRGFAVFSCKKNSRDYTFLHFCESWLEAKNWLNSYNKDPNYNYSIE
jgi:hypothetical protein